MRGSGARARERSFALKLTVSELAYSRTVCVAQSAKTWRASHTTGPFAVTVTETGPAATLKATVVFGRKLRRLW